MEQEICDEGLEVQKITSTEKSAEEEMTVIERETCKMEAVMKPSKKSNKRQNNICFYNNNVLYVKEEMQKEQQAFDLQIRARAEQVQQT